MADDTFEMAVKALREGGVIAYPTEAVYGFGCDPNNETAIQKILTIKQRPPDKGLILIAATIEQIEPFVAPLSAQQRHYLQTVWPGPVTFLMPVREGVSPLLTGKHQSLAVRVSGHPLVIDLCQAFDGAIVSTSANRSGDEPARTSEESKQMFAGQIDVIVEGETGGQDRPSEIRDLISGAVIRPG